MTPRISVIVPAYNVAPFLTRCLDSLAAQTHDNLEIIIIDDASTDETPAIVKRYKQTHPSWKTIRHAENGGLSAARNTGIAAATGNFIGFVDSDDWVSPTMFETLATMVRNTDCDIAQVQYILAQSPADCLPAATDAIRTLTGVEALREMLLTEQYAVWCRLYRRELFDSFTPSDPCFPVGLTCEDRVANAKLLPQAHRVAVSDRAAYFYFQNLGSISNDGLTSRALDLLEADRRMVALVEKLGDEEALALAQDRAAKGPFSLLVKWARFGTVDATLDEDTVLPRLWEQYRSSYSRLMASQISATKRSVAWLLKHCPSLLHGVFTLYNRLPASVRKR